MRVGDEAFVLGNPFGLPWSFSSGVISGFDRAFNVPNSDQVIEGMIQFDAAANPGNSGGPLLNRDGHVVGIVTGILNPAKFVGVDACSFPGNIRAPEHGESKEQQEVNGEKDFQEGIHRHL